jgi:hypothetical protein
MYFFYILCSTIEQMPALVPKKKDAQKFKGFPITAFCFEEV